MVEVESSCPRFFCKKFPPPCFAILLTYLDEIEMVKALNINKHTKKLRDSKQLWKIHQSLLHKEAEKAPIWFSKQTKDPSYKKFLAQFFSFKHQTVSSPYLPLQGVTESSKDYNQSIHRTLDINDEHGFWSSTGSKTQDASEFLLYKLPEPTLIKEVFWRIFKAEGFAEKPYPSNKVKILIGF